jgi:hypothetical protein
MADIIGAAHTCEIRSDDCDSRSPVAFDRVNRVWACLGCMAHVPAIPDGVDREEFERRFPGTARRMKWRAGPWGP